MIVITINVSGVKIPQAVGAEKFEPLHVFTLPLALMEPEDVTRELHEALRVAVNAIKDGTNADGFDRVNLTMVLEHVPNAGYFVLEFKAPESEQNEIIDRKPELN